MEYGVLKTTFSDVCQTHKIKFYIADFSESLFWAELFLTNALPAELIKTNIRVANFDPPTSAPRTVTLPTNVVKIESVRMALERDGSGNPVYLQATLVSPEEYLSKVMYSSDIVASVFNGSLNVNPDPAGSGTKGAIELVYRVHGYPYMSRYNGARKGVQIATLDKAAENRTFSTVTLGQTWADLGLDETALSYGYIYYVLGTQVFTARIDRAWTDEDAVPPVSYLHIEDGITSPTSNITNGIVSEASSIQQSQHMFKSDDDEPFLEPAWHGVMLDLAIGRYLLSRKPEIARGYLELAMAELQRFGVSLPSEYGGNKK